MPNAEPQSEIWIEPIGASHIVHAIQVTDRERLEALLAKTPNSIQVATVPSATANSTALDVRQLLSTKRLIDLSDPESVETLRQFLHATYGETSTPDAPAA